MTNLEITQKVFPGVPCNEEGKTITIDSFLYIDATTIKKKSIRGFTEVPGFVLTLDTGEDVGEMAESQNLERVLIEAAKFYAGWKAEKILQDIRIDQWAKEIEAERLGKRS